ncbi:IgGFc-binding protein-like [Saccostrea echinata]|uniref:IgGFc-binding protein-like n=1 Tax=Saccostrea echinata TaxID=191078 RepID=UPI002A7FF5E6|nr:IgGFc-binding protein-like [Saccostrea echinata]
MFSHNTELFVILTFVSGSAALYCLSCTDSVSPRHCHTVRKCSEGEVCFTESHTSENGAVVYDTGCATSQTCRTKRAHHDKIKSLHGVDPHYHHSQCMECCSSHLCNNQGCGQPGYPMTRGPACFDCQQVSDPMLCDKIKVCEINQVCYLQKEMEFGDVLFASSCINKHACTSDVDIFGKRNLQSCSRCCLADLCNNECGDLAFPSSTSTSSLASTTTVTPSTTQAPRSMGSRGREFFTLFMKNYRALRNLTVYITTNNETTVKILTSPHLNANIQSVFNFTSNFKLDLPLNLDCEYFTVEPKGLILQTSELSSVTIFDSFYLTSNDGTLIIPTQKLSNKYIVSSTDPHYTDSDYYSQFAIGALYNRTNVEIIFKFKHNTPLTIQGKSYRDGDIFTVMLERFDTLQIAHTTDLSGSFITSTKPIAVFSGNRCQDLKDGCSHMVTQLPPTTEIDTQYIIPPFYHNAGTLIQVLSENRSSITSSVGSSVSNFHLNEKGYKNIEVTSNVTTVIESDHPVLVTAFGMGIPYHPYVTVVPGVHQYLDYYKIIVPAGYEENFICVIVSSQSLNSLRINGFSVSHYTSVYQSALTLTKHFSIRTFKVQSGTFVLSTTDASQFGLFVYGHRHADGYGFAGNFVHP